MELAERLLVKKEKIEEAKIKSARLEGQNRTLHSQLKRESNCSTIKQAKAKEKKLTEELESLEAKTEEGLKRLEEDYDW